VQDVVKQGGFACAEKAAENSYWHREMMVLHIRSSFLIVIYAVPGSRWRSHSMTLREIYSRSDFGALTATEVSMRRM